MGEKLVFIHIPKNGGTSLTNLLSTWFPGDRQCPYRMGQDYINNFSSSDLEKYDYFTGHVPVAIVQRFLPEDFPKLTVLRHPVDRLYSLYAYWRTYKLPSEGVVEHSKKGAIPTLYSHELQGPLMARKHGFGSFLFSTHPYVRRAMSNPQARFLCKPQYVNYLEETDPAVVFDDVMENIERQNITVETLENSRHLCGTLTRFAERYGHSGEVVLPHDNKSERIFFEDLDESRISQYIKTVSPVDFMLYEHFHISE